MSELNFTPDSIRDLIELVSEKHLSSLKSNRGTLSWKSRGNSAKQPRFRRLLGLCPFPRKFPKGLLRSPRAGR